MEVASHPPRPMLHRFGYKESRFFAAPSLLPQSCARKGLYTVCSPCKQAILGVSTNSLRNGYVCFPRKNRGVSWHYFKPIEGLNRPSYDNILHKPNKLSRYIVARSELAGAGNADAWHPLSEYKLGSKVRGMCFYAVTAVNAIFLFVLMMVAHPFVLLFDRYRRRFHHFVAKTWATFTVTPFFKIKYEGLENLPPPDIPAVYVSNHQSFLDIYCLLTLGRSFKLISKTSIFLYPIIGWAMFLMGVIPLKRLDVRSQLDCLKRCMDLMVKGASVFFFPEGTRSKDGKLGAFKKGAFSVAAKTKVPVVPITLMGTGKIMPAGMEGILNEGDVKVVIHKPIEGSDAQVLCNEARNTIADELNRQ
ncbi:1-acyl-sn-glycerol-3-phosphate acyltransferase BAT2, chloroplastic-like isoform X1 [Alnus glutinosa]|uniref:1-acyl-sn-glycerol-3-phosphate acyltransferase BAT2, chloroplastic-like isoform X1 n=1 Tax=Alnus glutinosa TaxID=3517 RepID=UPI002D77A04C|nr:1-acyl-sn-glycerol-3-phosphate acyltransferase BAT2, chloroplastic-like isoform X1 [Alnus glutinosa]